MRELNITGAFALLDWIKAHNNHASNERADKLARNSVYVKNVFFGIQPPISLLKKEISSCIHKDKGMAEKRDM